MACTTTTKKGRSLLVRLRNGGSPVGSFTMAMSNEIALTQEYVEANDKSSNGWRQGAPGAGLKSATISMDGVFKSTALETSLQELLTTGSCDTFDIIDEDGERYEGDFIVTSYSKSGEHNTNIEWSATLESTGEITYTSVV